MDLGDRLNRKLVISDEISLNIKCNMGISLAPSCGKSFSILYQCAKIALDISRKDPVKNFHFYQQTADLENQKFVQIVSLLDDAIEDDEFRVEYQPQYELSSLKLIGAEALIRWKSRVLGEITPAKFIPISEESGHIVGIGKWVIHQVSKDIVELKKLAKNNMRMAINLSALQLAESNLLIFIHQLHQSVLDNHLTAENFDLEITEHAFMEINSKVIESLAELKEEGFHISLDDFGTGYSSLSYIQKLPLSNLKIDISFIRLIGEDNSVAEIIKLIINLAHVLGLNTVAEGIETQGQLDFLKVNNCDYGQGYLFSKPVSFESLKKLSVSKA